MPRHYAEKHSTLIHAQRVRARSKRRLIFVVVLIAIVAVAVLAGLFSYNKIVNSRLNSADTNAPTALAKKSGDVSYTLFKTDLGISDNVSTSYDTPLNTTLYMLMRLDPASRSISFVTIPNNLEVTCSDKKTHPLYIAETINGDGELISSLNAFFDLEINHFVSIDEGGLKSIVDDCGGVSVNIPKCIDDPYASSQVYSCGNANLDGNGALSVMRAKNIAGGNSTKNEIMTSFVAALLDKAIKNEGLDFANTLSSLANKIYCDASTDEITATADKFRPFETIHITSATLSGSTSKSEDTNEEVFAPRTSETQTLIQNFKNSGDVKANENSGGYLETSGVHVEVRNGAGIDGAATKAKSWLETQGFTVDKSGNADEGNIYPETLIVYTSSEYESAADTIVSEFGCGRAVNGGDYYTSDSNVIVIIGADWSPLI